MISAISVRAMCTQAMGRPLFAMTQNCSASAAQTANKDVFAEHDNPKNNHLLDQEAGFNQKYPTYTSLDTKEIIN